MEKSKVFQSKMNHQVNISFPGAYLYAYRFIKEKVKVNEWHQFSLLPERYSFAVIDILDRGYIEGYDVYFDEFFEKFKIVKSW